MKLNSLRSSCNTTIRNDKITSTINAEIVKDIDNPYIPESPLFLPYQQSWLNDKSIVAVTEKSRQIGWSYIHAFRAVYKAAANIRDTIVTSYNKTAVRNFLKDCTFWAKIFNVTTTLITEKASIRDSDIGVFELRFLNGRTVTGLPGDSVNLRSYSGRDILLDEIAYRQQSLEDILAAAMAAIIHGGTIRMASTHCGIDSEFDLLCQEVRKGNKEFKLHKVTFQEAVKQGLYREIICRKKKILWTPGGENEWTRHIYSLYGIRASEELDVIPGDFGEAGKIFNTFARDNPNIALKPWEYIFIRYHDLASSEEETACYSASIKVALNVYDGQITIVDWYGEQLNPSEGDRLILDTAEKDGSKTVQILEQEPGSASVKWMKIMRDRMYARGLLNVQTYTPHENKLFRLIPAANAAQKGYIKMLEGEYFDALEKLLRKTTNKKVKLVSDLADCLSGIFNYIVDNHSYLTNLIK